MADSKPCFRGCDIQCLGPGSKETINYQYMKITKHSVVALTYELVVDGQVADKCTEEKPLEFIQGMGYLLPKFEGNIEGLEAGEEFSFTLEAKDGYGEIDPQRIIDLPVDAFRDPQGNLLTELLYAGNVVTLVNQLGQPVPAKILEVGISGVKMDINHPMAGKTLNFRGKIVSVREASEKELKEGLHGELVHNCNCSGGCNGDCESGCEGGCEGGCQ